MDFQEADLLADVGTDVIWRRALRRVDGKLDNEGRIQGSACVTLGISVTDVVAWSFTVWLCIEVILNAIPMMEIKMNAAVRFGLETLAALRGLKG